MWNLVVFAAIGLIVGVAARLAYPNRQGSHILGTMILGAAGALSGGMISWVYWPDVEGQFQTGNLVLSAIGGIVAIQIWAAVSYARKVGGRQGVAQ